MTQFSSTFEKALQPIAIEKYAYGKFAKARKINGLDANLGLNRALWTLAERMAELKAQ